MSLDMDKVLDRLLEARKAEGPPESKEDAAERAHRWLEAKNVQQESFDNVLYHLSKIMIDDLLAPIALGRLGVLNKKEVYEAVCEQIGNIIGQGFELGYVTCEMQQEMALFGEDD